MLSANHVTFAKRFCRRHTTKKNVAAGRSADLLCFHHCKAGLR